MGLQKGTGMNPVAAAAAAGTTFTAVADWSSLPGAPSNGDYAYIISHGVVVIYLSALGQGLWVPPDFVESGALSTDVGILLEADAITGLSDTDPVDTWTNLGAKGDFTGTTTTRPLWQETDGPNGDSAVLGDGTDDIMAMGGTLDLGQDVGRIMVACLHQPKHTISTADRAILNISRGTDDSGRAYTYYDTIHRAAGRRLDANSPGAANTATGGRVPTINTWDAFGTVFDYTNDKLHVASDSDTTYSYGINAALVGSSGNTSDTASNSITIFKAIGLSDASNTLLKQLWAVTGDRSTRWHLNVLLRYLECMAAIGGV